MLQGSVALKFKRFNAGGCVMVHLHNLLLFPKLVFVQKIPGKRGNLVAGKDLASDMTIYNLDWEFVDRIKRDHWLKTTLSSDSVFPGTLPEEYDEWLKGMVFSINDSYMDEIRRTARSAQIEWGTSRRYFDTMVREICLQPSIEYAYVSFRLLADCLYDMNTQYFYRGPRKEIATQALLYRFWSQQCGSGLIRSHSKFDKIEKKLSQSSPKNREFLMGVRCDKCNEGLYMESSSKGWKVDLSPLTIACSCGNVLVQSETAPGQPISFESKSDSVSHEIREFINAIDDQERKIGSNREITVGGSPCVTEPTQRPHTKPKTDVDVVSDFFSGKTSIMSFVDCNVIVNCSSYNRCTIRRDKFRGDDNVRYLVDLEVSMGDVKKYTESPKIPVITLHKDGINLKMTECVVIGCSTTPPPKLTISVDRIAQRTSGGQLRFLEAFPKPVEGVVRVIKHPYETTVVESNDDLGQGSKVVKQVTMMDQIYQEQVDPKSEPKTIEEAVETANVAFSSEHKSSDVDQMASQMFIEELERSHTIQVLIDGVPFQEIPVPGFGLPKEDVVDLLKKSGIKNLKGKRFKVAFYDPDKLISIKLQK